MASLAVVALSGAALVVSGGAGSADDSQGGRPLTALLSGANEVNGGDPGGTGTARVTVNPGKNLVCWDIRVDNLDGVRAGHIHEAVAGKSGPVVVTFFEGTPKLKGCTTPTGTTARELLKDPAGYYVNIHTATYKAGAIRGQLSK